jgi:hypothetical protein
MLRCRRQQVQKISLVTVLAVPGIRVAAPSILGRRAASIEI